MMATYSETPYQVVQANKQECSHLRDQLLEILVVAIATTKEHVTSAEDHSRIPEDLIRNIERLERYGPRENTYIPHANSHS